MMEAKLGPQIEKAEALVQDGDLKAALEELLLLERKSRQLEDLASNSRILLITIRLCFDHGDLDHLNEYIILFSKKHGLLKQSISKMVHEAMTYIDRIDNPDEKFRFLNTLCIVTEGKIFLEIERARITRIISKIKDDEGDYVMALNLLSKLQVETFGSMKKEEKAEFFLEQMRLAIINNDYSRVFITSRNINQKIFQDEANSELKLRYYNLMIQHAIHENEYLEACKCYRHIYDTKVIAEDEKMRLEILMNSAIFVVLAPYNNEQYDMLHRINLEPHLSKIPEYKSFLKCFVTNEIIHWSNMKDTFAQMLRENSYLAPGAPGAEHLWEEFHVKVIEHSIRVIAQAYDCIKLDRLAQHLDLDTDQAEGALSKLVVNKTIYARIDRPLGVVSFQTPKSMDDVLNEWSANIHSVLGLLVKTKHLITKEEMVHNAIKLKQ